MSWSGRLIGVVLVWGVWGAVGVAQASWTAPALEIHGVEAHPTAVGTLLRVEGALPFEPLVQRPYDLHVLVRDLAAPASFVRFHLPGSAYEGREPAIEGGLGDDSLPSLLRSGRPCAGARILEIAPDALELLLPRSFGASWAEVQLFVVYKDEPIYSNVFEFRVEETKP